MKQCLVAMIALLLLMGPVYGADKMFDALDKNKDGRISEQEYMDAAMKTFDKLDRDRNGSLDENEIKALPKADRKSWMAEMDADKDGKISRSEFEVGAKRRFSTADEDESRYIESREWSKWETKQRAGSLLRFSF
jgi:hypothetical protein